MSFAPFPDLADLLREENAIAEESLQEAVDERARTGESLAGVLHRRRVMDEAAIASLLVSRLGLPYLDAAQYGIEQRVHHERPQLCLERLAVLDRIGRAILIAVCDIPFPATIARVVAELDGDLFFVITTVSAIDEVLSSSRRREPGTGRLLDRARLWDVASRSKRTPVDLAHVTPQPKALEVMNEESATYYGILPLTLMGALTVAVENPFDVPMLDDVATRVKHPLRVTVALDVRSHIARSYGSGGS